MNKKYKQINYKDLREGDYACYYSHDLYKIDKIDPHAVYAGLLWLGSDDNHPNIKYYREE